MEINFSEQEEKILNFWKEKKIFEKTLKKPSKKGDFVFCDGPPFATGAPHYGHIVGSLMKDVVPRYWTMQGYHVERKWGWDCHGLPIENIVEEEMAIKNKKEIEEKIGVEKFNEACRNKVLFYADEWKKFIPRMGRWADMEKPYKTMDLDYMESIWWVLKQLWDKGLIYEDYKIMHICPRCETTLSQSEVSEGYKEITDISVVAKFKLKDEVNTYILAWTTTPWTLLGNIALAVNKEISYLKIQLNGEYYILAKNNSEKFLKDKNYQFIQELNGQDLVGKSYEPLFSYFDKLENRINGFKIYHGDFVNVEEGTGVVHIAPAFGDDDMNLAKKYNLPFIRHITLSGRFILEIKEFEQDLVKPLDNPKATDIKIANELEKSNKLFLTEEYLHSYPHCWRCDTPLLNFALSSWFVRVAAIKPRMLELAKKINWTPSYLKQGRFGKWLEGAEDWAISRQRFWGSVLPIWKCECGTMRIFGSQEELEKASNQKIEDLHKHIIDKITVQCEKCEKKMFRIPDVLDCWFESGAMPYAQLHYPFENKEKIEKNFPAQFIAEGVDQTRCWFYYLLVLSIALMDKIPFENVIVNGIVLAENGQKMSKRLKNYPDPSEVINKYGADALRYYLLTSPVMKAETLNFSEKGVEEICKKLILILSNVFSFYKLYEDKKIKPAFDSTNILDKWIVSRLQSLIKIITEQMNAYDLVSASRPILDFIDELSTWYLRRSRERFKGDNLEEKNKALQTLKYILLELSKASAPFIPFLTEKIYQETGGEKESVHLENWPEWSEKLINKELEEKMDLARKIVSLALAKRVENKMKVRQPLSALRIKNYELKNEKELLDLIKQEVNVKEIIFESEIKDEVELNTEITPELKQEGIIREIIRHIQQLRKKTGLIPENRILIQCFAEPKLFEILMENKQIILKETNAKEFNLEEEAGQEFDKEQEFIIDGQKLWLKIEKI
ncbi:isoleucine--tRNA ligase [Patescibacteria group bacterium]|nr:isoleucine--tRNA ligase [Patescibacteria group bacterium]